MSAIQVRVLRSLIDDLGGNPETARDLIQTFRSDASHLLEAAELAAVHGDTASCRRAVHTLKTTSATFGALDVAASASSIEQQIRTGVLPSLRQWDQLEHLWLAADEELGAGFLRE